MNFNWLNTTSVKEIENVTSTIDPNTMVLAAVGVLLPTCAVLVYTQYKAANRGIPLNGDYLINYLRNRIRSQNYNPNTPIPLAQIEAGNQIGNNEDNISVVSENGGSIQFLNPVENRALYQIEPTNTTTVLTSSPGNNSLDLNMNSREEHQIVTRSNNTSINSTINNGPFSRGNSNSNLNSNEFLSLTQNKLINNRFKLKKSNSSPNLENENIGENISNKICRRKSMSALPTERAKIVNLPNNTETNSDSIASNVVGIWLDP